MYFPLGIAGFHICHAHMTHFGGYLEAIQDHPVYQEDYAPGSNSIASTFIVQRFCPSNSCAPQIQKAAIIMEHLHNNDRGQDDDEDSLLRVQFQAIMMNYAGKPIKDNNDYNIIAAAMYGTDEYIWVGKIKVTTALVETVR